MSFPTPKPRSPFPAFVIKELKEFWPPTPFFAIGFNLSVLTTEYQGSTSSAVLGGSAIGQRSPSIRRVSRIIFVLTFCLASSGHLDAQKANPSRQSPTATPIPIIQVASEADAVVEQQQEIEASLAVDRTTGSLADGLSHLSSEIGARIGDDIGALRSNPSILTLHQLKLTWESFGRELSAWEDDVTRTGENLDDQLARQDGLTKSWQSTLQSVEQGSAPKEVLQHAQLVLDAISRTRQVLDTRRTQVLTLQNRLLNEKSRVRTILTLISESERRAPVQALSRDSPPIWSVQTSLLDEWSKNAGRSFSSQVSALTAYANRVPFAFLIHALVTLILGAVLYWLRWRLRHWSEQEPGLQRVVPVFALPLSAALALSSLFSRWALYAQAPRLFLTILLMILLIATVRILRRLVSPKLFPILSALVVVFFVDQLRESVAALPAFARLLLLGEAVGTMIFLIWLIRSRRLSTAVDNIRGRSSRTAAAAAWIGLIFFSAAFLTNIFGYVSLADLLVSLFLWSAYFMTVLYGVIRDFYAFFWRKTSTIIFISRGAFLRRFLPWSISPFCCSGFSPRWRRWESILTRSRSWQERSRLGSVLDYRTSSTISFPA